MKRAAVARVRALSLGACRSGALGNGFSNTWRARRAFGVGACHPRVVGVFAG